MRKKRKDEMQADPASLHTLSDDTRPELITKAHMHTSKLSGIPILFYPQGLLLLNTTGAAIIQLCDGQHTFFEIITELAARYHVALETVYDDINAYIMRLHQMTLVEFY